MIISYTSLGEAFHHSLLAKTDHIGLLEVNRNQLTKKLSYQDIFDQAVHTAKHLQHHHFKDGAHCGIIMSNQSLWNTSAIGVFFAGGVLVPLDYKLGPEEHIRLILHADLTMLIVEYPIWHRLMKSADFEKLSNIVVFVTEVPEGKDIKHALHLESAASNFSFVMKPRQPEDIATIVYSSGTFGRPKGCMLTHANYLHQAQALAQLFPVGKEHTYFSFIPTNHAIDFMCGFFLPIMHGSKTIHQRTLRPEFIASTISEFRVTHMALVPMLLKNLETKLKNQLSSLSFFSKLFFRIMLFINQTLTRSRPCYKLSRVLLFPIHKKFGNHLQYIFVGGAYTDPVMAKFFYDIGFSVAVGYGLTEAGTVITVNDLKPFRHDTVGKPLSITQLKIQNPNDAQIGEIIAKGPTVMKGYYKDDELTSQTIIDGWLQTGDLGYIDKGHLIFKGRRKNMIVTSGGKNIYPEDIEHYFQSLPFDDYCVLAGSFIWPEQTQHRDELFLVYYNEKKTIFNYAKAIEEINQLLPEYKRISYALNFTKEFPKTATLKIKRPVLAENIAQSEIVEMIKL